MLLRQLRDETLAQYAYLIGCQQSKEALLIDPERDIDRYVQAAAAEGLRIVAVAETHIHADFLSGARAFAEQYDVTVYVSGEGGDDGQVAWVDGPRADGAPYRFVRLRDGDTFRLGNVELQAVHTPGHTPEHLAFLITDHGADAFEPMGYVSGDFVFVGDLGRPDLLETAAGHAGDKEPAARRLFSSIERFLKLPDFIQVFPGHGAGSACGKALGAIPQSTVGYERRYNASIAAFRLGEARFVREILDGQPEPPMYFARMKRLNREGPPLLGGLPRPKRLAAQDLEAVLAQEDAVVLDTRADRAAFMARHLPGALFCPFDGSFSTTAGSYVEPEQAIYLILDEPDVEPAVRALVRVGLDRIEGYVTEDAFLAYAESHDLAAIEEIDFAAVERLQDVAGHRVLDVRRRSEFEAPHVPGALHAPHVRLPEYVTELPKGETLLVHCASGVRSAVAAAYLAARGFDVKYVNDRFADWAARHPEAESVRA